MWASPGALAKAIDPDTFQTPALDLIDQALVDVEEGRINRLIISMPRQEGKSPRVTKVGPLWFLTRNPDRRIAVVSHAPLLNGVLLAVIDALKPYEVYLPGWVFIGLNGTLIRRPRWPPSLPAYSPCRE